jgi:hypothetical protein
MLPGSAPARTCSTHYARSSSRSTRPSKPSSTPNDTGGHTPAPVMIRDLQRTLALTAAIWHNDHTSAPVHRSLTAYDHRPSHKSSRQAPPDTAELQGSLRGPLSGASSRRDLRS